MARVNVTIGMTPAMLAAVDEQWQNSDQFGSRAEYIRACIREDTDTQLPTASLEEGELGEVGTGAV